MSSLKRRACARARLSKRSLLWSAALLLLSGPARVFARPAAPSVVCEAYPDIPDCSGRILNCAHCHTSTYPVAWNSYGLAVVSELSRDVPFEEALPSAMEAIADDDADEDGLSNLRELELGTAPGDPSSGWSEPAQPEGEANPRYDVGHYDARFAYRRVSLLYCGHSPSYEDLKTLEGDLSDPEAARTRIHDALSACLESGYWQKEVLPRLADKRIRPLHAAGPDSQISIGLRLVIGDYNYDYRLWRYALTADRDMRELLTAQYHVVEAEDGSLKKVTGTIEKPDPGALAGGQPLPDEKRAGLLTTQWFLAINTMFSGLPRTTAAQAYRAFLGADISASDGISPVSGEPSDVDHKGVGEPQCAACHATLDPLAYAFAKYEGIDIQMGGGFGGYRPGRLATLIPEWDDAAQQSVILGHPVESLPEWAQIAANSDMFKRNLADMFFEHALSRGPGPAEADDFRALWQSIEEDDYSANRLIHRLVDLDAFGAP